MPSRRSDLNNLLKCLQANGDEFPNVQVGINDSMEYNIGTKRNIMLKEALGKYVVFIDDDDEVSPNYVSLILEACKQDPDCIGINGTITTNGHDLRKWFISKEFGKWYTGPDGTYYRTPNHISPVRRELALQAGFPEIAFGEDAEYSKRLMHFLRTESTIIEPIYNYKYISNK
ncbi:glycosyltransferase family 2 protein [Mucilaginibacter xinganensis]|uniref:Glycosyltransferase 2-like domain-containing protein n=1 Tax=Mucilaginibacter xinganensis TaxID=1234841 RepID=A0A223NX14_9SPHI|nr:glycosyltransferase [Mucilaginibacter xinganensis]ASU34402.1 hypothetical protein MuYL_2515 [Mucilaginibacter xinganensis]